MKSNEVLQDEKYKVNVENRIRQFTDLGIFPATIKVIKPILLSEKAKEVVITLSEKEGEDKEPKDVNYGLADIFHKIFSSIPEEFRFSDVELSRSETSPTGGKSLTEDDVQKYADEKKVSYSDALIELSKDGKLID